MDQNKEECRHVRIVFYENDEPRAHYKLILTAADSNRSAIPFSNWRFFLFLQVTGLMAVLILKPLLAERPITGTAFFMIYLGKIFFFKVYSNDVKTK